MPLGTWIDLGGGWRVAPQQYVLYTGLQYRYDPGVALVGIGAFVLLAGLIISFYFLPARLYVRVDPAGAGRSRVGVAATTVKGYDVFERVRTVGGSIGTGTRWRSDGSANVKMPLDELLLAVALASYALGALALIAYFFSREEWLRDVGAPLAIMGCVAQFAQLGRALRDDARLAAAQPLRFALALCRDVGGDLYRLRFSLPPVVRGRIRARACGDFSRLRRDVERRHDAAGSLAAIVLGEDSRAARRLVVRGVFGRLRLLARISAEVLCRARLRTPRTGRAARDRCRRDDPGARVRPSDAATIRRDTPALSAAAAAGNPVARWLDALPSLSQLDVIVYRAVAIGLPLISIGIITGAMWAKEAWGAYWQWDPKETAALFSWILYLAYMHLHTRHAWRGVRTNWVSVIGFLSIIFCYLGVNIWISGLHSYKV